MRRRKQTIEEVSTNAKESDEIKEEEHTDFRVSIKSRGQQEANRTFWV